MALYSRLDLEGLFKNGKRPSETEFRSLIESTLNRKDDQFMGRWKAGRMYRSGDVVIFDRGLWEVVAGFEEGICSQIPPGPENPQWQTLNIAVSDEDWQVYPEDGVMFAKVYDLIGIGREFTPDAGFPEAKLELLEQDKSRYLILPKPEGMAVLTLVQLEGGDEELGPLRERTYFITGLDNDEVGFTTDTAAFVFRSGEPSEEDKEAGLNFKEGDILVTIRGDQSGLARVGISTLNPAAMLDITDRHKGQFLFNPEDKTDPVFTIVNLDPGSALNYLASGVGGENAVFLSDAPRGFVFRHGAEYGEYCAEVKINQGAGLMIILLDDQQSTRVGIGNEDPVALVDAVNKKKYRFQMAPVNKQDAAFTMENGASAEYFGLGLGNAEATDPTTQKGKASKSQTGNKAVFVSNAPEGFSFNQGGKRDDFQQDASIDHGQTHVVIKADGKVGIGTEHPETRLEINDGESGIFRFNLDDKAPNPSLAIINTRPEKSNYLTMGASNRAGVFITNSEMGYAFRLGADLPGKENNNDVEIEQKSESLFSIRPEYKDPKGNPQPREMRIFPETPPGAISPEIRITGQVGIERRAEEYELDVEGSLRTIGQYMSADRQKMSDVDDLEIDWEDFMKLAPKTFKWDPAHVKNAPQGKQIGLVGQDVKDIYSEVVRETAQENKETYTYSLAYQNLVPVLIKAIQEQQLKIQELEQRLNRMENAG